MSRDHVSHREIAQFAEDRVNLPKAKANEYRAQARRLREKLETYLEEHPDFTLRKMLLSGSLAKGTAVRSLNDIDVACYVSGAEVPTDVDALLNYIAERLRKAFPNFSPDQVQPQTYSVTVSFKGSGLDVDVVPILYKDDPQWYGDLVSQDDGSFLKTSIPVASRVRWKTQEGAGETLRPGRTYREVLGASHEARAGRLPLQVVHDRDDSSPSSATTAWTSATIRKLCSTSSLSSPAPICAERIVFSDYYKPSAVGSFDDEVQIIDPVNAENNVARLYTAEDADAIVDAALDAGDAVDAALRAPTKQLTVAYWQKVFGSAFQV